MKKTVKQAQQDVERVRREVDEIGADIRRHMGNLSHLSTWVKEYPVATTGVFFATGLLVGRYVTPRRLASGLGKVSETVLETIVKSALKK